MFDGPILKLLARLSLPMFAGMIFHLLYNITDTIWISRIDLTDPSYVGGTGMIFPIFFLVIALGNGIVIGVSSLVARSIGKRDHSMLGKTAESALVLSVIFSAVILFITYGLGEKLVNLLGAEGDYRIHALEYLYYITPASVLMLFMYVFFGILQGEGRMKQVMAAMMVGTISNIILDPIFILVLGLGVRGAAAATGVAQVFTLIYVLRYFFSGKTTVRIEWSIRNVDTGVLKEIAVIGFPQVVSQVAMAFSFLIFNRVIMDIDPLALTAFTLCGRFDQVVLMPILSIGAALLTMIGQNWGRGNYERVRKIWWHSILTALGVVLALAALMVVLAPVIYPFFTDLPEVVRYAVLQTRILEFTFALAVIGILGRSVFQAIGNPLPALLITSLRLLVLAVPAVYLYVYVFDLGIYGVFLGMITGNVFAGLISLIWVPRALSRGRTRDSVPALSSADLK